YPDEDWTWKTVDEYLLGDRILVAPILTEGATSRPVKLPGGAWTRLSGGDPLVGDIEASASPSEIPVYVKSGALLVLYPGTVDTMLAAPTLASATTLAETNDEREIIVYAGNPGNPAHGQWNDETGPEGTPQYTWSGRPMGTLPASATFNGTPVSVTKLASEARVTITGDGTLELEGGGTLTIARGVTATYSVIVR
ncbi:MAG TPA: hypothetical protein VFV99_32890, partial [Kofleriaceae bacterium]|nr:hypothetical protein [Kofleriaceae bacterium]